MPRQTGEITVADPSLSRIHEGGTITCGHCNRIVRIKPGSGGSIYLLPTHQPFIYREVAGAWCGKHGGPICLRCHQIGICKPLEARLEELEGKVRQSFGLGRFFKFISVGAPRS